MSGSNMARNKSKSFPSFDTLDDMVQFFDARDMGEYWAEMPEAHFDVNIKRKRHLVAIDEEIIARLTEIAKSKKVSPEKLVNSWLQEKIHKVI